MKTLEQQKAAAIEDLMAIDGARRGQLSTQYFIRKGKDGKIHKRGPYYIWQRWVKGQKHSVRIPKNIVEAVEADLEKGKKLQVVFDRLFDIMEEKATIKDNNAKKKTKCCRQPSGGKSRSS